MIVEFIGVALLSCIVTAGVIGLIYFNTKACKMRGTMFHRYYVMGDLWLKTGSIKNLTILYGDRDVDVNVRLNCLAGTNKNCRVYSAFINDIECATAVKLCDEHNSYYTFYVDKEFDEKEVWDILDTAYKYSREQKELSEAAKLANKRSVLGGRR